MANALYMDLVRAGEVVTGAYGNLCVALNATTKEIVTHHGAHHAETVRDNKGGYRYEIDHCYDPYFTE